MPRFVIILSMNGKIKFQHCMLFLTFRIFRIVVVVRVPSCFQRWVHCVLRTKMAAILSVERYLDLGNKGVWTCK